jgi:hypothetical protein
MTEPIISVSDVTSSKLRSYDTLTFRHPRHAQAHHKCYFMYSQKIKSRDVKPENL